MIFAKETHDTKCCWLRAYHGPPLPWLGGFKYVLFLPTEKLGEDFEQIFSDGLKVETTKQDEMNGLISPTFKWEILGLRNHPLILTHLGSIHFQGLQGEIFAPKELGKHEISRVVVVVHGAPKKGSPLFGTYEVIYGKLTNRWLENGPGLTWVKM